MNQKFSSCTLFIVTLFVFVILNPEAFTAVEYEVFLDMGSYSHCQA